MSIAESYNSWADFYDSNKNKTRDLDQQVTQQILQDYKFQLILELGCGTGKNSIGLLEKTEAFMVTASFTLMAGIYLQFIYRAPVSASKD